MLEEPRLLIRPWAAEAAASSMLKRLICVPESGRFLGLVRTTSSTTWWSWLSRRTLQVLETEDASLLMTVYRPRGLRRTWEVYDAEEHRVGFIYRNGLWEGNGTRLASTERNPDGSGRFVSPTQTEVANFEVQQEGMVLGFKAALEGKPFARMTILAAVVSW